MDFRAFRQETFTTALPTPGQSCAPTLRAHASAKAVLIFPGALGALQGSFHDVAFSRGATLRRQGILSIPARHHDRPPDLGKRRFHRDQEHDHDHEHEYYIASLRCLWNNRRTP